MSRVLQYVLAVALASFTATRQARGESGAELKRKILAEWDFLLQTLQTVRWEQRTEGRVSQFFPEKGETPGALRLSNIRVSRRLVKKNAGALWSSQNDEFDTDMKPAWSGADVRLANNKYAAKLKKPKGSDGWVVAKLGQQSEQEHQMNDLLIPWFEAGYVRIDQLLQQAGFGFTRVEELPGQPRKGLLRAHFQCADVPSDAPRYDVISGYIDFDPAHSYRPMKYEYHRKSKVIVKGVSRGTLEYREGEGIPILEVRKDEGEHQTVGQGTVLANALNTFSDVEYNGKVNEEEFRLTHFGLPEPQGVVWEKSSRWWIWFSILGVMSLAAGAYFQKRLWRRQSAVA